jgi:hypothetical protein
VLKAGLKGTFHERFTIEVRPTPNVPMNASLYQYGDFGNVLMQHSEQVGHPVFCSLSNSVSICSYLLVFAILTLKNTVPYGQVCGGTSPLSYLPYVLGDSTELVRLDEWDKSTVIP